jgi:hypothetical protein
LRSISARSWALNAVFCQMPLKRTPLLELNASIDCGTQLW